MSIFVAIASRTLSTAPASPSGMPASVCLARVTEAAAATALSREVAISSTSCESAVAFVTDVAPLVVVAAWASRIATKRLPMASPSPAAETRSSPARTRASAPRTSAAVGGSARASATSGSFARRSRRRSRRPVAEARSESSASIVARSTPRPAVFTRVDIVSRSARRARASSSAGR